MRGGYYRRARPKISFALATMALFMLAAILTGITPIQLDLTVLDTDPKMVAVALVFTVIAAALLYEW